MSIFGYPDVGVTPIRDGWMLDPALSFTAKGVAATLAVIERRGDSSQPVIEQLVEACAWSADSLDVIHRAVEELETAGHLRPRSDWGRPVSPSTEPRAVIPAQRRAVHGTSVVYYMRRTDGDIKIGFSANLGVRARNLARQHGTLTLLATEPGGLDMEQHRHREFGVLRISPNREWFRPGRTLLLHILGLADRVADRDTVLAVVA